MICYQGTQPRTTGIAHLAMRSAMILRFTGQR